LFNVKHSHWIINNQLGRRNLTPEQTSYLRGKRYNLEKLRVGRPLDKLDQNDPISTADRLADEYKVSAPTIKRDGQFAEAVDTLSPEQMKQVLADLHKDRERLQATAVALRKGGYTQEQVAKELGVDERTIQRWEAGEYKQGDTCRNTSKPDWRVKLSPEKKAELIERHYSGES
jgi:DNA-binding XRE family transcriptional regulator